MIHLIRWGWLSFCLLVFAGPLIQIFLKAYDIESEVWVHLRTYSLLPAVGESLFFSLMGGAVAAVIGTAWAILSLISPVPTFLFSLSMAMLLTLPSYVLGFLFLSFLDYSGPLQTVLSQTVGDAWLFEPRTRLWAAFLYGLGSSPYVYFSVLAGFQTQVRTFVEANVSLGAGFTRTLRGILLPGLSPWILGGATLVALEALADFGFVDLFGINTLSRLLYKSWGSLFSFGGAARVSLVLLGLCIFVMALSRLLRRPKFDSARAKAESLRHLFPELRRWRAFPIMAFSLGLLAFNGLPTAILLVNAADFELWRELSWGDALMSTVSLALTSCCVVGIMMAALFFLLRGARGSHVIKSLMHVFMVGYGLPGTLLAVGFYLFAAEVFGPRALVSDTATLLFLLIMLYFVKFGGLMLRGLLNQATQVSRELLEVSSTLGSPSRNFFRVELPLYAPALILGFFLLFLEVVKELPAALMIKPFAQPTLPLRVYQYAAESDWARASVFALVMLLLIAVVILAQYLLTKFLVRERHEIS